MVPISQTGKWSLKFPYKNSKTPLGASNQQKVTNVSAWNIFRESDYKNTAIAVLSFSHIIEMNALVQHYSTRILH